MDRERREFEDKRFFRVSLTPAKRQKTRVVDNCM